MKIKNRLIKKIRKNPQVFLSLILLLIIAAFLRLINLNWDQGHFLHPDERLYINASTLILPNSFSNFFSTSSTLNPHMFYYGSFPLYLYRFIDYIFFNGSNILLTSRFVSAFISIFTLFFIYKIGSNAFSKKVGLIASLTYTFMPGSIQHAHYNTTESLLIFLLTVIIYLTQIAFKKVRYWQFILLAFLCGISYGTKIIGLSFLLFPGLVFLFMIRSKEWKLLSFYISIFVVSFLITAFLASPYQIIDWKQFTHEQSFMQGVILGKTKPVFVIIYNNTLPYLYQLFRVFPFTFGFITFPIAVVGLVILLKSFSKSPKKRLLLSVFILFPISYFLWSGTWFAKYVRYFIILAPFISIWTAVALERISKKILIVIIILISLNGLAMLNIYIKENTRIQASRWIYNNTKQGNVIAGEHWDDNLPLPMLGYMSNFSQIQLTVYDPDNAVKIAQLSEGLSGSDYFITSSRRVYQSIINNKKDYPMTTRFYSKLNNGKLGFDLVKKFTNYPFYFSDDFADESFQSYDHPPVAIYKNIKHLKMNEILQELTHD